MQDESRNAELRLKFNNDALVDLTHTKIDVEGLALLHKVGKDVELAEKIRAMFNGEVINKTEKR